MENVLDFLGLVCTQFKIENSLTSLVIRDLDCIWLKLLPKIVLLLVMKILPFVLGVLFESGYCWTSLSEVVCANFEV